MPVVLVLSSSSRYLQEGKGYMEESCNKVVGGMVAHPGGYRHVNHRQAVLIMPGKRNLVVGMVGTWLHQGSLPPTGWLLVCWIVAGIGKKRRH